VSGLTGLGPFPLGEFYFGTVAYEIMDRWPIYGSSSDHAPQSREHFERVLPELISIYKGDRAALRDDCHPIFADLVDESADGPTGQALTYQQASASAWGIDMGNWITQLPVRGNDGHVIGYVRLTTTAAGMSLVGTVAAVGDVRHLARMQDVVTADRRPAAILFADLEASTLLSRTLSTTEYFSLARRLVRAADQCVVDAGGVVGRHLGDGVTAFFLAETVGGESRAARSCIEAARSLRETMPNIAARSDLDPNDLVLRFGLHWGSMLYVGLIKSIARSEVTALGDEVNEAARIEACAKGGRTLASKALVERLTRQDAKSLGIDSVSYTLLGDLESATEKARRDASMISVCDV
jgi:class 3 adenylate cyclase